MASSVACVTYWLHLWIYVDKDRNCAAAQVKRLLKKINATTLIQFIKQTDNKEENLNHTSDFQQSKYKWIKQQKKKIVLFRISLQAYLKFSHFEEDTF